MAGQGLKRAVETPARTVVDGRQVNYLLRRSHRRTVALQVDARGVRVAAPLAMSTSEIERFVHAHGRWLLERLDARAAASPVLSLFEPQEGACFALFGGQCRLRLGVAGRSAVWARDGAGGDELRLPAGAEPRTALVRALRVRALPWFRERVAEYCYRLDRPVPPVRLSSARTRWGSCSTSSGIRLHWRLIHLSPSLIDYVVAHEVSHLLEMNHSPRFWAVVERLYPRWREARAELRCAGRALPIIALSDAAVFGNDI